MKYLVVHELAGWRKGQRKVAWPPARILPPMSTVTEADAAAIRAAYRNGSELSARRRVARHNAAFVVFQQEGRIRFVGSHLYARNGDYALDLKYAHARTMLAGEP